MLAKGPPHLTEGKVSGCTEGKKVKWHLTPLLTLAVNNEEGVQILINAGLWLRANHSPTL